MKNMNKEERIKMVKAMEYITRQINDEDILYRWLMVGVADGDIEYGDLSVPAEDVDLDAAMSYCEDDESFAELMSTFLRLMCSARKDGGLFCDGVVSTPPELPFGQVQWHDEDLSSALAGRGFAASEKNIQTLRAHLTSGHALQDSMIETGWSVIDSSIDYIEHKLTKGGENDA